MLGSHSTLQSTKVLLKKLCRSWKTAQKDTFVWRICNCLTLAPLGFFETLLKLNHSGSRTCNCSPCQKTDLRKEQPEPETKLQHRLCTTFSGTTPQDQILPRLNTSTEVRQGQEFLREEILAAPKFHNMISKPLTEDLELAHVVFFSLLYSLKAYPHGRDLHWSSLWTKVAHGKDSCWRKWWRTVSHGSDPMLGQGKDTSPWGGSSGRNIWWADCSHFPVLLARRRQRIRN